MRQLPLTIALLCLPLFFASACGNANTGKAFTPYNYAKNTSSSAASTAAAAAANTPQPLYCRSPLLTGSDPTLAAAFTGSTLCATQAQGGAAGSRGATVLLHVNSTVPSGTALCIVPFINDNADTETCFAIQYQGQTGQFPVQLTTDSYTSLVLLPQANLAAYKQFLATPGALPPPRLLYSM